MSPLKIQLLLRMHAYPYPNIDLPEQQAFAPAMMGALDELAWAGLANGVVSVDDLRNGPPREWLTDKGRALVKHLCAEADSKDNYLRNLRNLPPLPDRPAPPTPAVKPSHRERPDYETMLRDDFAKEVMRATAERPFTFETRAELAYKQADAMMAERAKAK